MDFGTIKTKIENGEISSTRDFADMVNLVFTNACTYNQPGSDVYIMATTIRDVFVKKINPILTKQGLLPLPPTVFPNIPNVPISRSPVLSYQPVATPPGYNELKKSVDSLRKEIQNLKSLETKSVAAKAKSNEIDALLPMTRDEKRRLSMDINKLSSEHLGVVVKIIKQKMPIGDADEIVIDIDSLDVSTLRELEKYIQKVKKRRSNRSRSKRTQQLPLSNESKLEQAKKTEELTVQKLEDVQKRLNELKQNSVTNRNFLHTSTTISFANPDQDVPVEENVEKDKNESESDSGESGSDTSEESGSESESENDSASESESENM